MMDFPGFLKTVSLFSDLSEPDLCRLAAEFKLLDYVPGAEIVREGETSDSLFIVKEGFVNVMRTDQNGKSAFISMLSVKDYFGEAMLFEDITRTATIVATEKVQLLMIGKAQFTRFLQANLAASNRILFEMLKQVFVRLSATSKDLQAVRATGLDQSAIDKLFI